MDDHPPNWGTNGSSYLETFGMTDGTVSRINPFLSKAEDEKWQPVDGIAIAKGLVDNYSLTQVELYRCGIDQDGMAAIAQALSVNKFVTYLGLGRNKFYTAGGIMLAEALKVNQTLATIDLSWNELRSEFAVAMAEALHMNNSLQRLLLDKNKIGDDGCAALASAVAVTHKLRFLSISDNRIGAVGISSLGDAMKANRTLQVLDVSQNGTPQEGVFSLCTSLTSPNNILHTVNLSYSRMGPAVLMLGAALEKGCRVLRELNLEYCHLKDGAEWQSFVRSVGKALSLCSLSIARNEHMGDAAIQPLCETLAGIQAIRFLDLTETGITPASGDAIAALAGSHNNRLLALHLSENDFPGVKGGEALAKILGSAQSPELLGASRLYLGAEGMTAFVKQMRHRTTGTKQFLFRSNQIKDEGFVQLVAFINSIKTAEYLDIANNDIGTSTDSTSRLFEMLDNNPNLPYYILDDKTLVDRQNAQEPLESFKGKAPPTRETPAPPVCAATLDLGDGMRPTAGFATYSLANGSVMKRQLEMCAVPGVGLLNYAGKPVRSTTVWRGLERVPTTSYVSKYNTRIDVESSADVVARYESNIGGLLISDDQMRREFNRLDLNGNGYLEKEEFKGIYRSFESFGVDYTEAQLTRLLNKYGDDGKLTFDEFCIILLQLVNH